MSADYAIKVEIAFDSNFSTAAADRTWTNVSQYVTAAGVEIMWGRTDALSKVEPSECSLVLKNGDGRFTASNTGSPYYPNVKLDRPIRVTVTPTGGAASVRFVGYINGWPVAWPGGTDAHATVAITATSRTGRLGLRNALHSLVVEDALSTGAAAIFPLNDPSGSSFAADVSGNDATPLAVTGPGAEVAFGGEGVEFAAGRYLTGGTAISLTTTPAVSFACTFIATTPADATLWGTCTLSGAIMSNYADGRPHRYVVTRSSGGTVTAKIDDTAVTSPTLGAEVPLVAGMGFTGTLLDLAYWSSELTAAQVTDDYTAFNGGLGEVSDVLLSRIAGYLGIPSAEVDADAGVVVMGGIDSAGMSAVDALAVVESTEGGILADARDGDLRLIGRRDRYHVASALTLDMASGHIARDYSPTLDRSLLRNDMTGTNAASSVGSLDAGGTITRRATNETSVAEYGTAGGSVEVAAAEPDEAYSAASWIVANFGDPSPRVPSLGVNMRRTDLSLALRESVLAAFIGTRITLSNRLSQDASSSADFFVEGGTEVWSADVAALRWNVTPIGLADDIVLIDDATFGQIDAGYYIGY